MNKTTHLFATPSFLEGVARTLDIGATLEVFNTSKTPNEADAKAIKKDWEAVGEDILFALKKYE